MCSPHQSHISAVQQFPHIALALIQSQCPYYIHPCKKAILCVKLNYGCPILCTALLQMDFMRSKNISFNCSCIPILFLYFHASKPMAQLHHNTRTFKIRHFDIPCQDSKTHPYQFQYLTPSFAYSVSNPNGCSPLHIATIHDLLTTVHLPPTLPCPWLQCWHLSPPTIVQFEYGEFFLRWLMVSVHPVHAENSSNTVLAIKYHKTDKHCCLAYHLISHRPHRPYPSNRGTCFMLHCMWIPMRQARPTPQTPCQVFTALILNLSSATIPAYSACPYPIPMSILCVSIHESYSLCQIWTTDTPFCAQLHYRCIQYNPKTFIVVVVAFQFSSCTSIYQSPWHNCATILGHSKYDISVFYGRIPKIVHARFNVPLPHLHRL